MHAIHRFAILCLLPVSTVAAQTATTIPPGYLDKPGDSCSVLLGRYANQRLQHADGSLRGQKHSWRRIECRLDLFRRYGSLSGNGRTWTNVTIDFDQIDADQLVNTFSANVSTKRKTVYSSQTSWPAVVPINKGTLLSAPWGKQVAFPLKTVVNYDGTAATRRDLLWDFRFRGGRLHNGQSWTSNGNTYYLDGVGTGSFWTSNSAQGWIPYPFSRNFTCNDSAQRGTIAAHAFTALTVYGPEFFSPPRRNTFQASIFTRYTAPARPVFWMTTIGGSVQGIGIGALCNKLRLNLALVIASGLATPGSRSDAPTETKLNGKYPKFAARRLAYTQAAWADSRTNQLRLTTAHVITLPDPPTSQFKVRRTNSSERNVVLKKGGLHGVSDANTGALPMFRMQ